MNTTYKKESEHEISVVEVIPEKIIPAETLPAKIYDYDFLLKQKDAIQTQWDEQLAQKNKEIEEINARRGAEKAEVEKLIAEADKLGVKAVVVEAPVEEIVK